MPAITLDFAPYKAWSLAGTLRNISGTGGASRIELAPQSPFAGDPEFDSSSLSAWTTLNSGSATTIDANTSRKSHLYIAANTTNSFWFGANRNAPAQVQTLSGDFDIYAPISLNGPAGFNRIGLLAQSTSNVDDHIVNEMLLGNTFAVQFLSTDNATGAVVAGPTAAPTATEVAGNLFWLRLKRVTNTFTAYYLADGKTPVSVGSQARADFSADAKVGVFVGAANTAGTVVGSVDFLRTWPPYDTGTPLASLVLDSGYLGTVWTMSSFQDVVNELKEYSPQSQIGFGSVTYDYGAGDSSPPSLSGTYRTTATMQGLSNPSGRYFKLSAKFTSANGYELPSFSGATLSGNIVGRNALPLIGVGS